jgi:hypothetical protein
MKAYVVSYASRKALHEPGIVDVSFDLSPAKGMTVATRRGG